MVQMKGGYRYNVYYYAEAVLSVCYVSCNGSPKLSIFPSLPVQDFAFCAYLLQNMDLGITFLSIFYWLSNASEHKS
jgi:hypothetical protein